MNKEFKKLHNMARPSNAFKKRLWQRLDAELPRASRKSIVIRYGYVVGFTSVVIMTTGMGSYAYASDRVTPDSSLYGVKIGIESVESRFHRSPESMAAFHAKMAMRRDRELNHVKSPEAKERLELKLSELLSVTDAELKEYTRDDDQREIIEEEMQRIHELRFKEQVNTHFQELHNRVDEFEVRGDLDHEEAQVLRKEYREEPVRRIYNVSEYNDRLDRLRLDSIHR